MKNIISMNGTEDKGSSSRKGGTEDKGSSSRKGGGRADGDDKAQSLELFLKIGLDESTAMEAVADDNVRYRLKGVIREAKLTDGCDKVMGNLLYQVATRYPKNAFLHRERVSQHIASSKIKNTAQLDAALAFLAAMAAKIFSDETFDWACGVGKEVSVEDIKLAVNKVFEDNKPMILEQRYHTNVGGLIDHVRIMHRFADPIIVKELVDAKLYELLGDRTAEDDKPVKKKKELHPYHRFPLPEQNFKVHTEIYFSDGHVQTPCNSREILDEHLKVTGGAIIACFPVEPKEFLHIGHVKGLFLDFGLAKKGQGHLYLRYDDTNPEAKENKYTDDIEENKYTDDIKENKYTDDIEENEYTDDIEENEYTDDIEENEYTDDIEENKYNDDIEENEYTNDVEAIVEWMGPQTHKVIYISEYFQELYELAVELIRRGHAYVDHQTPEEIKEYSEKKMNSPWRDRPIEESLKLFNDMRRGKFDEGEATLRMKQDMQSDNFNMHDLIAYRIKFAHHPRAGDEWCIYPSIDYAQCIVDSLENITHLLCTPEFLTRLDLYYWILEALGLYMPYACGYTLMNVSNTVVCKDKLNHLVTEKWVDGWDDPRLMTLAGLRRRGVTPTAINAFVRGIGITRSDCSLIRLNRFEYHVREELNKVAARAMVVLNPLKVVITNLDTGTVMDLDAKRWPVAEADNASSVYKVPFSNVVYIERTDFRTNDSKDYYGLAPGKSVLLRYAFPIKCTGFTLADDESIIEIQAEYDPDKKSKPKGVLHWVSESSPGVEPLKVEVRLFDKLFKSENPAELEDWLGDLNPHSKTVISDAYAVPTLGDAAVGDKFQFERLGYFVVDQDSTSEKLVFNRTVTLRGSYGKGVQ